MDIKRYKQIKITVTFFIAAIVSVATVRNSYLLAVAGVVTGMLFMAIAGSKAKVKIDEREKTIREKAAHIAYAIFAPTLGISAFLLLIPSKSGLSVFSRGEFTYLDSLGTILAYLTLFLIALYALSYNFLKKKYGGSDEE